MELIAWDGERTRVYRALWQGEDVVLKKGDVWNEPLAVEELEHETKMYRILRELQGKWIPRVKMAGILNGIEFVLATEFMGTDICNERLDRRDCMQIRTALSAIHNLGVLHGDIRPQNILVRRDGQKPQFAIIDFGLSKIAKDKKALKREAKRLESLLAALSQSEKG